MPEFSTFLELTQEPKQPNYKCLASHVTGENTESQQQQDQEPQDYVKTATKIDHQMSPKKVLPDPLEVASQQQQDQEPQDYVKTATKIDHQMSPKKVLPDPLEVALSDNLTMDPVDLAKSRMSSSYHQSDGKKTWSKKSVR